MCMNKLSTIEKLNQHKTSFPMCLISVSCMCQFMCRRDVEQLVWHFDELATRSQACQSCIDIPCQSHKSVMCYKRTLHHGTPCWPHQIWSTNDEDDRFCVFQNNDKAILVSRFSCDRLIIIWTFAVEPGVHTDWCVVRITRSSQNHSKRNTKTCVFSGCLPLYRIMATWLIPTSIQPTTHNICH